VLLPSTCFGVTADSYLILVLLTQIGSYATNRNVIT
jgi:hypothetical protein